MRAPGVKGRPDLHVGASAHRRATSGTPRDAPLEEHVRPQKGRGALSGRRQEGGLAPRFRGNASQSEAAGRPRGPPRPRERPGVGGRPFPGQAGRRQTDTAETAATIATSGHLNEETSETWE